MSDAVVSAAPVAAPAASNETSNQNSVELSAEETQLESEVDASEESVESKDAKPAKKEEKKAKEVEKRLKKLKLKVDGEEFEEELDLDNDEALIKHLQMSKMGQKRAQEKADQDKMMKAFLNDLDANPFETMKKLGKDPEALIEAYINEQMERAKKTPAELEAEQLKAELKAYKEQREREQNDFQTKEMERLQQQAFQQYDTQMEETLKKSGLPQDAYTVKKMADYMVAVLEMGHDVTPQDVVDLVKAERHSDIQAHLSSLNEDEIEELLGQQTLNKLRKRRIAKSQETQKSLGNKVVETGKIGKVAETPKQKQSFKDFFKL